MADAGSTIICDADGLRDVELTWAADVAAGTWDWLQNMVVYIPYLVDVSEDTVGVAYYRMEKAMLPKASGVTFAAGDLLYYSTVTNNFSNVTRALTDVPAGLALAAAGTAATTALGELMGDKLSRFTATLNASGQVLIAGV